MGRTLLGVDLDESRAGWLVERLLSDEDLEKLADGGQPDDRDDDPRSEAEDDGDGAATRGRYDAGFSAADRPDGAFESRSAADAEGESDDGARGRLAGLRPLLLRAAVALAVLAVLAALVWRYLGRVTESLPVSVPGRSGDESDGRADGTEEGPPARRRAKRAGLRERTQDDEADRPGAADGRDGADRPADRETASGRTVAEDVDLGALVALATLALTAALVRKFGERDESDPLVDGPDGG